MSPLPRWVQLGYLLAAIARWARTVYGTSGALGFAGLVFALEGMGVPIPVEIPLYVVGSLMTRGTFTFAQTVVVTWIATMAGNLAGYLVGYYGGRPLVLKVMGWLRVPPSVFDTVEHWFKKYGLALALGTRWINWGFAQNVWLLGITRTRFLYFFLFMAVNDLLWAIAWNWIARHFVRRLHLLGRYQKPVLLVVLGIAAISVGVWWLTRRRRQDDEPKGPGGN